MKSQTSRLDSIISLIVNNLFFDLIKKHNIEVTTQWKTNFYNKIEDMIQTYKLTFILDDELIYEKLKSKLDNLNALDETLKILLKIYLEKNPNHYNIITKLLKKIIILQILIFLKKTDSSNIIENILNTITNIMDLTDHFINNNLVDTNEMFKIFYFIDKLPD